LVAVNSLCLAKLKFEQNTPHATSLWKSHFPVE
jgi:hypothetical protein